MTSAARPTSAGVRPSLAPGTTRMQLRHLVIDKNRGGAGAARRIDADVRGVDALGAVVVQRLLGERIAADLGDEADPCASRAAMTA